MWAWELTIWMSLLGWVFVPTPQPKKKNKIKENNCSTAGGSKQAIRRLGSIWIFINQVVCNLVQWKWTFLHDISLHSYLIMVRLSLIWVLSLQFGTFHNSLIDWGRFIKLIFMITEFCNSSAPTLWMNLIFYSMI